ncbi:MAG: efflux RND transporter permease subunit [Bacteroidales bacterium]|nr:efflux RND transporter permease subunit [Bacteroidales bacterium]
MAERKGISSFSVLLLMAVAAVVGIACFSQLKVQYTPSTPEKSIGVGFSYPGASARIVEAEVTSILEGCLANIRSCTGISSVSRDESGTVTLTLDKRAKMEAVRFEVASQIRNVWESLPQGCSYPSISLNARGESSQTAISFNLKSPLPSSEIARFVEDYLMYPLSVIEGVSDVNFYGQTPFEWVITFDADQALSAGITASQISSAIQSYYAESIVGMTRSGTNTFGVKLRSRGSGTDFSVIPVGRFGDRIVHLGDIATFRYQESLPTSYYRINGLNTLSLAVTASADANLISVVQEVKARLAELQAGFPAEITISVNYDASEYISSELDKIYFRTALCLALLLLFVFLVSRSWRYMVVIALTLATNILVSVACYMLVGLHIHIYTLAGITVSLGIIIDNSIVMIDHWTRYRTRSVFPALLSAVLTTVAALLVILLLPDKERANLTDFSLVIIINLCVSLLVSYLFVPALLEFFPVSAAGEGLSLRRKRRIVRWDRHYTRYIQWGARHRWVLVLVFIAAFGIPTCLLPKPNYGSSAAPKGFAAVVDKVIKWKPYADNRVKIDKILGTSFALFNTAMSRSDFYREPARPRLSISAGMPEGCSVQQLNEVMRSMENYLSHFDEIELFETQIAAYNDGDITVLFKPEFENSWVPHQIKAEIISMAADFGGANWQVSGMDDSYFNNNIVTSGRNYSISLTGYNYDRLVVYGQQLMDYLSGMRRVSNPVIWGSSYRDRPKTEFNVQYDYERLMASGISPYAYYSSLYSPLYSSQVLSLPQDGEYVRVRLESSSKDDFDVWQVDNTAIAVGEGKMKLSEVGSITKTQSGIPIRRTNQSYSIQVAYDFIGSYELHRQMQDEAIDYMNETVLPIGYKAGSDRGGMFYSSREQYFALILLVIALIFVICAVYFNSLKHPLGIIWLIPISFIGLFLIFGLTNFTFDKGGFASFVMLSGITVNAGIYLVAAWRQAGGEQSLPRSASPDERDRASRLAVKRYVRAFNRKIWPISLTILSSILGLIPFLFDGPKEVFWFAFAIGTIAGLVFSVLALVFYLPVFCCAGPRRR